MEQKFIFFWKPDQEYGFLSQWTDSPFVDTIENIEYTFPTAEHYMMWRKAMLFGDQDIAKKILDTKDPKKVKALGRKVRNFNEKIWIENGYEIVVQGNRLKFNQHPELLHLLLQTGTNILAEASPYDKLWGIGLGKTSKLAQTIDSWKGKNLLGKALMQVRNEFK